MTDSTKGNPSPPRPTRSDGDFPGLSANLTNAVPSRANLTGADLRDTTLPFDPVELGLKWEDFYPYRGPEGPRPEDREDTDPREPESPQVDPADEFIDALRRLEVLKPTGYSDIVPRSVRGDFYRMDPSLRICGTSLTLDLKEKRARRRAGKELAVTLVLTLVGAAVCTWTWMGVFLLVPGVIGLLLAGERFAHPELLDDDLLGGPALTFPVRVAGTYEERRSLGKKLLAASSVDLGIFTSALQILAGESAGEANPEVRERALAVLRDLYLKSEERRLDLNQARTIEKLDKVAVLEAQIEMLD